MEKVYREFKNKDVQFVGIFVKDREAEVQKFVQTYGISFPVGLDDGRKIADTYKFIGTVHGFSFQRRLRHRTKDRTSKREGIAEKDRETSA